MIEQNSKSRPSAALCRRIRKHQRAFLTYERLVPFGDPFDRRFFAERREELDLWQDREARRREKLLAHPVRSLTDIRTKVEYLPTYPGSDFLISGEQDVAVFLRSMVPANTNDNEPTNGTAPR